MSYTAIPEDTSQTHSEKRSAALFSVLAALGITLLKFLTGVLTGSLGMLASHVSRYRFQTVQQTTRITTDTAKWRACQRLWKP